MATRQKKKSYITLKDSNHAYKILCLAVESTVAAATLYAYHPHYYLNKTRRFPAVYLCVSNDSNNKQRFFP